MVDWQKQRVLIIGAARQGMALARYLASQEADVVVTDHRQPTDLEAEKEELAVLGVQGVFGGHPIHLLNECDLICPSAGVPLTIPLLIEARARGIPLSNDSQIFLETAPCQVIGITGSSGKTTTTSLVGGMVEAGIGADRTWIGGNIGNPLIADLPKMAPDHIAVMELSSFQLEIMNRAPHVAAVLNVTPNHLDRHLTMEAYTGAKSKILVHQTSADVAVLGYDDPVAWGLKDLVQGELITFGKNASLPNLSGVCVQNEMICYWNGEHSMDIFPLENIKLRGEHNLMNVIAACAVASAVGLSFQAMKAGVEGFTGVDHRLEFVRSWGGADWYNDSIATAPERAIAAIQSFDEPIVLLAGGRDKDLPWDEWANLVRQRVDHLIIFGEALEIVKRAIKTTSPGDYGLTINCHSNLKEAVMKASEIVKPGDVVLFSPGGTSFDEFRDFAERGDWFKKWVNKLPQ
jgi:UDP-N-acetylmuramoylalanine--D-glutamate ligase